MHAQKAISKTSRQQHLRAFAGEGEEGAEAGEAGPSGAAAGAGGQEEGGTAGGKRGAAEQTGQGELKAAVAAATATAAALKRRNTEGDVLSARERYLARKKQNTGG